VDTKPVERPARPQSATGARGRAATKPPERPPRPQSAVGVRAYDASHLCRASTGKSARQAAKMGLAFSQEVKPHTVHHANCGCKVVKKGTPAFSFGHRTNLPTKTYVPGPGEYETPKKPARSASPAYSMGKRIGVTDPRALTPGPGSYDAGKTTPKHKGTPSYTFGSRVFSSAELQAPSTALGPGEYDVTTSYDKVKGTGAKFTMGYKGGERTSGGSVPGPGAYSVEKDTKGKGPTFTMYGRVAPAIKLEVETTPGPGEYEAKPRYAATTKSYRMGTHVRTPGELAKRDLEHLGPGAYDVTARKSMGDSCSFSFGKRVPGVFGDVDIPGPGSYDQSAAMKSQKGPAFSMYKRCAIPVDNAKPGPGEYDIKPPKTRAASIHPIVVPPSPTSASTPGPGEYTPDEARRHTKSAAPAFSMGSRTDLGRSLDALDVSRTAPGPGYYNSARTSFDGPAFSIHPKTPGPAPPEVPGPGEYDVVPKSHGKAFTFGKRTVDIAGSHDGEIPGPGEYSVLSPKAGGPAFTIGNRIPTKTGSEGVPGPGEYELRSPKQAGFTMYGHVTDIAEAAASALPGPGAYDPRRSSLDGPAFSMYKKVAGQARDNIPGPGEYTVSTNGHGPAFTMYPRAPAMSDSCVESPGPGAYDTQRKSLDGPAFTMYPRTAGSLGDPTPGPGEYYVAKDAHGPAVSIHGRVEGPRQLEIPGPGSYDAAGAATSLKGNNPPAFSFGKRLTPPGSDTVVGPGEYDVTAPVDVGPRSPSFSFGSRLVDRQAKSLDTVPGPGSYTSFVNRAYNPSFTMGTRLPESAGPNTPGPGEYNVQDNTAFVEVCAEHSFAGSTSHIAASQFVAREHLPSASPGGVISPPVRTR